MACRNGRHGCAIEFQIALLPRLFRQGAPDRDNGSRIINPSEEREPLGHVDTYCVDRDRNAVASVSTPRRAAHDSDLDASAVRGRMPDDIDIVAIPVQPRRADHPAVQSKNGQALGRGVGGHVHEHPVRVSATHARTV